MHPQFMSTTTQHPLLLQMKTNKSIAKPNSSSAILMLFPKTVVQFNVANTEFVIIEDFSDLQTVESVMTKGIEAIVTTHESCFQRATICEKNDFVVDDVFQAWKIFGFIDAYVTESFIDNAFVKSHKLCCFDVVELISQNQKLL